MTKTVLLKNMARICAVVLCAAIGISLTGCKKKKDEVTLVSVAVTSQPTKKTYTVGEPFDLSGMVVTATYSDGSTAQVSVTQGMIEYDFSTAGAKTVTITVEYKGKKVTATITGITVNPKEVTLVSIAVSGTPAKTVYEIGEPFDPAGITVTATYSDNTTAAVPLTEVVFAADFSATAGTKTVKVSFTYKGITKDATITGITVNEPAPVIASVAVNWTGSKNFGIGEPLNSAEKQWTVTVTYQGGRTETIEANNAEIEWTPADFSATAGTNKTVTVRYKEVPATAAITGITVQTIAQRVSAIAAGGTATIYLYGDETISSTGARINQLANTDITLIGVERERTIWCNNNSSLINLSSNNASLTLGDKVTLNGSMQVATSPLVLISGGANCVFTMKDGSIITGGTNNSTSYNSAGGGAGINSATSKFVMDGGIITNCKAPQLGGGGVFIHLGTFEMNGGEITGNEGMDGGGVRCGNGVFIMNGGTITGNTASNSGGDVSTLLTNLGAATFSNRFELSGNSIIGNLSLHYTSTGGGRRTVITISNNNFSGSVGSVDLGGGRANWLNTTDVATWIDDIESGGYWSLPEEPYFVSNTSVITAGEGVTLTQNMISKFPLGDVINTNGTRVPLPIPTTWTSCGKCCMTINWGIKGLYGSQAGQTNPDNLGKLIGEGILLPDCVK